MSSIRSPWSALAVAVLIGAGHPAAFGQNPSKAPAKSGKTGTESKTATLGAGSSSGKLLTRDELRDCMKRQTGLGDRRTGFERTRSELERERTGLLESGAALKAEHDALDPGNPEAIAAYTAKAAERDTKVDSWNARNARLNRDAQLLNDDQQSWRTDCAGSRYREEDEIAIRRGR